MGRRFLAGWCVAVAAAWLLPAGAAGQTQAASEDWTVSRTAWGDPDFEGTWSFATITPLERPERYAGRDRLTAEEITALNQDALTRGDQPPEAASGEWELPRTAWGAPDLQGLVWSFATITPLERPERYAGRDR